MQWYAQFPESGGVRERLLEKIRVIRERQDAANGLAFPFSKTPENHKRFRVARDITTGVTSKHCFHSALTTPYVCKPLNLKRSIRTYPVSNGGSVGPGACEFELTRVCCDACGNR